MNTALVRRFALVLGLALPSAQAHTQKYCLALVPRPPGPPRE